MIKYSGEHALTSKHSWYKRRLLSKFKYLICTLRLLSSRHRSRIVLAQLELIHTPHTTHTLLMSPNRTLPTELRERIIDHVADPRHRSFDRDRATLRMLPNVSRLAPYIPLPPLPSQLLLSPQLLCITRILLPILAQIACTLYGSRGTETSGSRIRR